MKRNGISKSDIATVDLFCGVGGLTCGLIQAGLPVVAGYDIDETCRYAYEKNNNGAKFCKRSVSEITGEELVKQFDNAKFRILVGCAPCQPFSKYTQKIKTKSDRWGLLYEFARIIREVQPHVISMENVPELARHAVFRDFLDSLKHEGYFFSRKVESQLVYCPDYGIPQMRRRLVVLASKFSLIDLLPPTHTPHEYATVSDAIHDTAPLKAGETDSKDPLHRCSHLSPLNLKRIQHSRPGGTWRDWPEALVAECHRSHTGETYPSVYGRMSWDEPAPTMTTQFFGYGNGRFGHPSQDRAISLREGAILQTFPKTYQFLESEKDFSFKKIGRMIGNAVPVRLGAIIGKSILAHIENHIK